MAVLPKICSNTLKNIANPLFLHSLTNQHTSSGQVIGNGLVLALLEEKRSRDERDIIKLCLADRSRWFAYL